MADKHSLSKSRLTAFLQCPKRLWLEVNRPELKEESQATSTLFSIGHHVGDVARAEYPRGVLIGGDDLEVALRRTQALMREDKRAPIFEATFQHTGVLVRTDLLLPKGKGWHLAEVKSTTGLKPYHVADLAIQSWVARSAGVQLTKATVRHVNREFVYRGDNNYHGLFIDADIGSEADELQGKVLEWVDSAKRALAGPDPDIPTGKHCNEPFACPFMTYCDAGPKAEFPVEILCGRSGKALAQELRQAGFDDLRDVPPNRISGPLLRRIARATVSGKTYVNRAGSRRVVTKWHFPRAYLDFETIAFTVPKWPGTRPFDKVPFQWSCDIERKDGSIDHREFLDLSGINPARACAERLVQELSGCPTIVTYHAAFERSVIAALASTFADLKRDLMALHARVVDLLPVVRDNYYHRDMFGSFSIKAVLPTVTSSLGYERLAVQDGNAAGLAYTEAIDPHTSAVRKSEIEAALLRYCALDSQAMIIVARALCR